MDRRAFIGTLAGGLVAAPLAASAQQAGNVPRIGLLSAAPFSSITARTEAFRKGLRDLGYVEGQNIVLEWRAADDKWDRLPDLVAELVGLKVNAAKITRRPAAGPGPFAVVEPIIEGPLRGWRPGLVATCSVTA